MAKLHRWRSAVSLLIGISIIPLINAPVLKPTPVFAQRYLTPERTARIPAGSIIPTKYEPARKIIVAPDEPGPIPLTLTVARNILTPQPNLSIPAGTQIVGELVTMQEIESAQFVAKQLIFNDGKSINIRASSPIIRKTQIITNSPRLNRTIANSALGMAAAAAITAVTGDAAIASGQVSLNSGFGSTPELIGRFRDRDPVRLILIEPERDFILTLNSDLILRGRPSS